MTHNYDIIQRGAAKLFANLVEFIIKQLKRFVLLTHEKNDYICDLTIKI